MVAFVVYMQNGIFIIFIEVVVKLADAGLGQKKKKRYITALFFTSLFTNFCFLFCYLDSSK